MSQDLPTSLLYLSLLRLLSTTAPFTHTRSTLPLHVLTSLTSSYIGLLAGAAQSRAEHAGRSDVAAWDVLAALSSEEGAGEREALRGLWEERRLRPGTVKRDADDELDPDKELDGEETDEGPERRIRQLCALLRPLVQQDPRPPPLGRFVYRARDGPEQAYPSPSPSGSDDSDYDHIKSEGDAFSPASERKPLIELELEEAEEQDTGRWINAAAIPDYVPSFLPPFPGLEIPLPLPAAQPQTEQPQQQQQQRKGPAAKKRRHNAEELDPYAVRIGWEESMMAEMGAPSSLPRASPEPELAALVGGAPKRKRRELSPADDGPVAAKVKEQGSLVAFNSTTPKLLPYLPPPGAHALDINPSRPARTSKSHALRAQAAKHLSITSDMSTSSDSLFGSLPVDRPRDARGFMGFLPDFAPDFTEPLHPFRGSLPYTISSPVPSRPSPYPALAVPPPVPAIHSPVQALVRHFTGPQASNAHLQLFSRLMRAGPPGPLDDKGGAAEYAYVGMSRMLANTNAEWTIREFDSRSFFEKAQHALGASTSGGGGTREREREESSGGPGTPAGDGAGEGSGGGIKLSLKLGRARSGSNSVATPRAEGLPTPSIVLRLGAPTPRGEGATPRGEGATPRSLEEDLNGSAAARMELSSTDEQAAMPPPLPAVSGGDYFPPIYPAAGSTSTSTSFAAAEGQFATATAAPVTAMTGMPTPREGPSRVGSLEPVMEGESWEQEEQPGGTNDGEVNGNGFAPGVENGSAHEMQEEDEEEAPLVEMQMETEAGAGGVGVGMPPPRQ